MNKMFIILNLIITGISFILYVFSEFSLILLWQEIDNVNEVKRRVDIGLIRNAILFIISFILLFIFNFNYFYILFVVVSLMNLQGNIDDFLTL